MQGWESEWDGWVGGWEAGIPSIELFQDVHFTFFDIDPISKISKYLLDGSQAFSGTRLFHFVIFEILRCQKIIFRVNDSGFVIGLFD